MLVLLARIDAGIAHGAIVPALALLSIVLFHVNMAAGTVLVMVQVGALGAGLPAVASFETPAGGDPVAVRQQLWPHLAKPVLESDPVQCVLKGRTYSVEIRIEDESGAVRQVLKTEMESSLDQEILPDRPLVVGPVYMPNPDLAGRPDGKLDVTNEAGCPGRS